MVGSINESSDRLGRQAPVAERAQRLVRVRDRAQDPGRPVADDGQRCRVSAGWLTASPAPRAARSPRSPASARSRRRSRRPSSRRRTRTSRRGPRPGPRGRPAPGARLDRTSRWTVVAGPCQLTAPRSAEMAATPFPAARPPRPGTSETANFRCFPRGVSSRTPRSVSRGKRAPQVPDRLAPSGHVAVSVPVSSARDCFVQNPVRVTA